MSTDNVSIPDEIPNPNVASRVDPWANARRLPTFARLFPPFLLGFGPSERRAPGAAIMLRDFYGRCHEIRPATNSNLFRPGWGAFLGIDASRARPGDLLAVTDEDRPVFGIVLRPRRRSA